MYKNLTAGLLSIALALLFFAGCGNRTAYESSTEKVIVTMIYSTKMEHLERLVEERLEHVDFQCERTAPATLESDITRRLQAGHGPDLVVTFQPASRESGQYVLPLGGYAFSTAYESTILKSISVDDYLYYLPFPSQYHGHIVNKTLLEQSGLPYPRSDEELVAALAALREKDLGVSDAGYVYSFRGVDSVALGNYLVGCMVPDFLGSTRGVHWLAGLTEKKTTFAGVWEPSFSLIEQLLSENLINTSFFTYMGNSPDAAAFMGEGKLAASYGSSAFLEECRVVNQQAVAAGQCPAYAFEMLPFLGTGENHAWTITLPSAYIGINAALSAPDHLKKLHACEQVLELISTPDGQRALMADICAESSYLKEFQDDAASIPAGLEDTIAAGYVYHVKFPDKVVTYLGYQAALVLAGKKTVAACLAAVDTYYQNGSDDTDNDLSVIGSVAHDLLYESYNVRLEETPLGNLLADSIAALTGAPIAVANSGGIRASLYQGDVRSSDLTAVCPYDNQIIVVEMTGRVLWDMLENSLSAWKSAHDIPGGRFLQVSGIKYEFNSENPAGARLLQVTLADGTPIAENKTYTVAINDYMAGARSYLEGNGDGYTMLNLFNKTIPLAQDVRLLEETGETYASALYNYFYQHGSSPVSPQVEGRILNRAIKP